MALAARIPAARLLQFLIGGVGVLATGGRGEETERHWSFQPLASVPVVVNTAWGRNPIDAFVAAEHAAHGLSPARPATPRNFIRRLTFNLTGLPPTPQEVETYVIEARKDPQTAILNLTDRLLDTPAYGVRWARHWLDTVRYADYLREDPLGSNKAPLYELYDL